MTLYIIATPIGNLEDITLRALRILEEADWVVAEDTRRTRKILAHYSITSSITQFNDASVRRKLKPLLQLLSEGKALALVSDSGTPGISDPGYILIKEAIKLGIGIVPVPGPSAAIAALSAAGLPTDTFSFLGFLPKKEKRRNNMLKSISSKEGTIVLYDSPHRIASTLQAMAGIIPDYDLVIARELTKRFEEFIRGTVAEVYSATLHKEWKGELVLLINGSNSRKKDKA